MKNRPFTVSKIRPSRRFIQGCSGQSIVEFAASIPLLLALVGYGVDFGYFFVAAATITAAARNSTLYSAQGYSSPDQGPLPTAGPITTATSVAAESVGDLTSLINSSTTTTVQVCSKAIGTTGNLTKCSSYGPTATTYTPNQDPEAPRFYLQRVDITYTVQPPIPMSFFKVPLLPVMSFHRQVSMRALD